jgi:glycosyltransferase involved in cell wall biosynthesis
LNIGLVQLGNVAADTGGRNYVINLTKALAKVNRQSASPHKFVWYLSPNQKHLIAEFLDEHFSIVEIPPASESSVMKVFAEQILLPFYLLFSKSDVVYFPGNFVSLFAPKKTVVAIRSMLYYHHPEAVDKSRLWFRKFLTPPSAKRARAIITPSQDIKNDVVNFVGTDEKKIQVVNHGVDIEMFQKNYVESERETVFKKFGITKPFIMYASALWSYKNQDKLILAFEKLLREKHLDRQLVIVGKGINLFETYEGKLHELVKEKKMEREVIFTSHLAHAELKYLYRFADIFAYPSGYESFGNPLFEAWAAGVPVVCANVHSFPEMTLNGKCAVMVDPTNLDALTDALYRVGTDKELREKLIAAGAARVAEFSWQRCAKETLSVLESATKN